MVIPYLAVTVAAERATEGAIETVNVVPLLILVIRVLAAKDPVPADTVGTMPTANPIVEVTVTTVLAEVAPDADVYAVVVVPSLIDLFLDCAGDFFGMVVKIRTKALEVDVVPAIESLQRGDFVGKGAAGNDQDRARFFHGKAKDSEVC